MKKTAFFTMDVESFGEISCLQDKPRVEYDDFRIEHAIDDFVDLLDKYNIKATFFVLCSSLEYTKKFLLRAAQGGHEIALHGLTHNVPAQMDREELKKQLAHAKALLEKELNTEVIGYRAPCFAMTNEAIDVIGELGFKYDSSFLNTTLSYRRSTAKLNGFETVCDGILRKDDFYEIAPCKVQTVLGPISISGGGYMRLVPYWRVRRDTNKFLKTSDYYMFYCHPADIFTEKPPRLKGISPIEKYFIKVGRKQFLQRSENIIKMLVDNGFSFSTMRDFVLSQN